jgi:surface protein
MKYQKIFKSTRGAIDLATIIVGVVVAVVPWTQDRAAKADLNAMMAAQQSYSNNHTDNVDTSKNHFADANTLVSAKAYQKNSNVDVRLNPQSSCYTAVSTSKSGKVFWTDSQTNDIHDYTKTPISACVDLNPMVPAAQRAGVMQLTVDPSISGCSAFSLPLNGTVNVNITWGDGGYTNTKRSLPSHTYTDLSPKVVTVVGNFSGWGTYQSSSYYGPTNCITSVDKWQDTQTTNASYGFAYSKNLQQIQEIPSTLTNIQSMFLNSNFNGSSISNWNVSNIQVMNQLFWGDTAFNQPLNKWDISNVTSLANTFMGATAFNQPLSNWKTTNVTSLSATFSGATKFNQNINSWDVSNVTDMNNTFFTADAFNQPLSTWKTGNVQFMNYTLAGDSFNQNVNTWDTSNVTTMVGTFSNAPTFNQPLSNWKTGKVTDMTNMFLDDSAFNQDLSSWDTTNVTGMSGMFAAATVFNKPLNTWNTANVKSMRTMFSSAAAFNQPLSNWKTGKVTDMDNMFFMSPMAQNISSWTVSQGPSHYQFSGKFPTGYSPKFPN